MIKMTNKKDWWVKPGVGIMYQIEARPGWLWNRNYDKFNASMVNENGDFQFNGPYCKMKEWVDFSKKVGVDYHIFEAKWHDGICYFDTQYTDWKTPEDYCKIFSEESIKEKIPFMFYYSNVFDHNPQFDSIQPLRCCTPSFICMHNKPKRFISGFSLFFSFVVWMLEKIKHLTRTIPIEDEDAKWFEKVHFNKFKQNPTKYEKYMFAQLTELIEKYKPDGLWMDWWMPSLIESSSDIIMDFMKENYPNTVLTFNGSINADLKWGHYVSFEAHDVYSAWKSGNKNRRKKIPWELVGPAACGWDNPAPRNDPYEASRIATIIMASGGKFAFGMPAKMDGSLYKKPGKHLELFGKWYKPRRELFTEAIPMDYKGKKVPGIIINDKNIKSICSTHNDDYLLHLIPLRSIPIKTLPIKFVIKKWKNIQKIILEPSKKELGFKKDEKLISVSIPKEEVERIDTILRIKKNIT
ncbi:MAG: hypothetical protein GF329_00815 [Candidatus Lokiarchaeota archaeon]|nr:hypothetical protein [Candidatus Lokiarchaeota archaeon]